MQLDAAVVTPSFVETHRQALESVGFRAFRRADGVSWMKSIRKPASGTRAHAGFDGEDDDFDLTHPSTDEVAVPEHDFVVIEITADGKLTRTSGTQGAVEGPMGANTARGRRILKDVGVVIVELERAKS